MELCTFATSGKLWVSLQSFVLKRWASASSSGLPENSGLKYDQFNCGCTGFGTWVRGAGGCTGFSTWAGEGGDGSFCIGSAFCTASCPCCPGGTGSVAYATGGLCTVGSFSAGGLLSAIVAYLCSLT